MLETFVSSVLLYDLKVKEIELNHTLGSEEIKLQIRKASYTIRMRSYSTENSTIRYIPHQFLYGKLNASHIIFLSLIIVTYRF